MAEHGVSRLSIVVHLPPSDSQGVSIYPLKWGAKRPLTRKAQPHGTTKCSTKNTRKTIVTSWYYNHENYLHNGELSCFYHLWL